jgi:hypothetical protein
MTPRKKTPLKIICKSVWSGKMAEDEKKEAKRRVDCAFDFIFQKTIERMKQDQN